MVDDTNALNNTDPSEPRSACEFPPKLTILYRDADLIAIDKPAGLLVHRSAVDRHATEFALQRLRDQIDQKVFPCHRLDRPTSGILLFALNEQSNRSIQRLFAEQETKKTYHAVVRGWVDGSGTIDYPLRSEANPSKVQEAVTDYCSLRQSTVDRPVGRYNQGRFTLIKLSPRTGRTHQLRRHMAHLRHPIIGDTRHGDGAQNDFARTHLGRQILLLRAVKLEFPHPSTQNTICIEAPPEPAFEACLQKLRLTKP